MKMGEYAYHRNIHLSNFTVFKDTMFDFVPGINVLVGENGAGKTHLMKVMYAYHLACARTGGPVIWRDWEAKTQEGKEYPTLVRILQECFQVESLKELFRFGTKDENPKISGEYGDERWQISMVPLNSRVLIVPELLTGKLSRPVFIPFIDMMAHSAGYLATSNDLKLPFDRTCEDMVTLLTLKRREAPDEDDIISILTNILKGTVEKDERDRFYLVTAEGRIAMPVVAEGFVRIAALLTLYKNGWLAPGTTLFWDEPETNLNPALMDEVIGAALSLARTGVQVFLATHSYIIFKELAIQSKKEDSLRYFSLTNSEDGVIVNPADKYLDINPNSIERQYTDIYDRDVAKQLEMR